jgi:quinoprotein glucose dehydrogenase
VKLEAARAIYDVPIEPAMPALAALTADKSVKNLFIFNRAVGANYRLGKAANAKALAALAVDISVPEHARKDALNALALWANPNPKDRLLNEWRPLPARGGEDAAAAMTAAAPALLKDAPPSIQETVAKLAAKLSISGVGEPLFQLASNTKAAEAPRIEAIRALVELKDPHVAAAAKAAIADKNAKIRSEGLQALAGADPAAAVKAMGDIVNTGSTVEKQGALLALAQIQNQEALAVLSGLLDKLIAKGLPAEIQLDVIEAAKKHDDPGLKDRLAKYEAALPASDDLGKFRVALAGGDATRGRKIFREKAETQCLRCHKCEDGDSVVGPELTHIGSKKDRAYILESIVYPNKQIAEGFETVVLTLDDGNIVAGRLVGQDATALKIETVDDKGKPQVATIPLAQIKQRDRAPSPMPPNLTDFLSKSELRDLVEYLATRK